MMVSGGPCGWYHAGQVTGGGGGGALFLLRPFAKFLLNIIFPLLMHLAHVIKTPEAPPYPK